MNACLKLTRRDFLTRAAVLSSAAAGLPSQVFAAPESKLPPIVVFSKVYQELKLSFDDAAALTAQAGLDGVDPPVRPAGEVLPERVAEDLPRYHALLQKRGLSMPLITTAITSTATPHAEEILKTAKRLGVQHYRLGSPNHEKGLAVGDQIKSFRAQLKDVAALNKQLGIGALFQNHSPAGRAYLGGDLNEMREVVEGFDPEEIGVAFDIGHALIVHGDDWRKHFEALKPHIRIIYVKDARREGRWVRFGEGDVGKTDYFKLLRQMGYHAPVSLHIEYDWVKKGEPKTRATLLEVLRHSATTLRGWLQA